jgi:hypothetical protein
MFRVDESPARKKNVRLATPLGAKRVKDPRDKRIKKKTRGNR